jgi:hypothetical protein
MYNEKMKHSEKYEDILMAAVGFTDKDLAANQRSEFSETQIERLTEIYNENLVWLSVATVLIIVGLGLARWFHIVVLPLAVLGGLVFFGCFPPWRVASQDLRNSRVEAVEGYATLDVRETQFVVKIEEMEFQVNKETFLAFKNGEPYRVFYAPNSKRILSAEWLR